MNIPKIQVICEPRNHGFLNKFYRANNDSGILYHQTKVEYKSHLPYWHHYVPMWWPGLGDFGMNSGILIDLPSKEPLNIIITIIFVPPFFMEKRL